MKHSLSTPWSKNRYSRAVRVLRTFFSGYSAKDGFDLRKNPFKSLTAYKRRKIREQLKYIDEIQSGIPKRVYRVRSKKKLRDTLVSQGIINIPKNLKVAFIPDIARTTEIKRVKTRKVVGKDRKTGRAVDLITMAPVETVTMDVTRRYLFIKPEFLVESPLSAVREAMSLANADLYSIQAGVHEITTSPYKLKASDSDKEIAWMLDKLMKKYSNKDEGNYWANWLGGLVAYSYPYQSNYDEYRNTADQAKMKAAAERKRKKKLSERVNRKEIIQERQEKAISKAVIKSKKIEKKRERAKMNREIKLVKKDIAEFISEGVETKRDRKMLRKLRKLLRHLREIRDSI